MGISIFCVRSGDLSIIRLPAVYVDVRQPLKQGTLDERPNMLTIFDEIGCNHVWASICLGVLSLLGCFVKSRLRLTKQFLVEVSEIGIFDGFQACHFEDFT